MTTPHAPKNNDAPQSRPMSGKTLLDDFHPSRFLKVADLLTRWKTNEITCTISRVTEEETTPSLKDIDPATKAPRKVWQPAFYFLTKSGKEWPSAYLLSAKVDIESLKAATGAQTAEELPGKRIKIKVSEHRQQAVLRIDPTPPTETK
jgi:hypothetical protein